MHDVVPLLSEERADEPDGLWATKQYGDLKVLLVDFCSLEPTEILLSCRGIGLWVQQYEYESSNTTPNLMPAHHAYATRA